MLKINRAVTHELLSLTTFVLQTYFLLSVQPIHGKDVMAFNGGMQ